MMMIKTHKALKHRANYCTSVWWEGVAITTGILEYSFLPVHLGTEWPSCFPADYKQSMMEVWDRDDTHKHIFNSLLARVQVECYRGLVTPPL